MKNINNRKVRKTTTVQEAVISMEESKTYKKRFVVFDDLDELYIEEYRLRSFILKMKAIDYYPQSAMSRLEKNMDALQWDIDCMEYIYIRDNEVPKRNYI